LRAASGSEIVEHQRRQHQQEPGAGDGFAAKVAHVGVERFCAGQGQHHRAEDRHANTRVNHKEAHAPRRVQRIEHFGLLQNAVHPQAAQHQEPGDHHRAEQLADAVGAVFLDQEQRHQYHQGNRHHPFFQAVERQFQAFDGRQH